MAEWISSRRKRARCDLKKDLVQLTKGGGTKKFIGRGVHLAGGGSRYCR